MDKWYIAEKASYIYEDINFPVYSDSVNCLGFSGTIMKDGKYIVKMRGDKLLHNELIDRGEVEAITNSQVEELLNAHFGNSLSFSEWDKKFNMNSMSNKQD